MLVGENTNKGEEEVECWSGRDLQGLLGYSKWENFENVIDRAKEACTHAGESTSDHFPDVRKTIPMPKEGLLR